MEEIKAQLEQVFLNNTLTDIEVYNVHEKYFELKEGHSWIFDGGIELSFGNKTFTLAWDYGNDSFDYSLETNAAGFLKDLEHYAVDIKAAEAISSIVGETVRDVKFVWEFYQEFNDEGELSDEKFYVPMGLDLEFSNGQVLQIGIVEARLDRETLQLAEATYNLVGQLLVSVDNKIEIDILGDA